MWFAGLEGLLRSDLRRNRRLDIASESSGYLQLTQRSRRPRPSAPDRLRLADERLPERVRPLHDWRSLTGPLWQDEALTLAQPQESLRPNPHKASSRPTASPEKKLPGGYPVPRTGRIIGIRHPGRSVRDRGVGGSNPLAPTNFPKFSGEERPVPASRPILQSGLASNGPSPIVREIARTAVWFSVAAAQLPPALILISGSDGALPAVC